MPNDKYGGSRGATSWPLLYFSDFSPFYSVGKKTLGARGN